MDSKEVRDLVSEFLGREVTKEDCAEAEPEQMVRWYGSNETDFSVYDEDKWLIACAHYTANQTMPMVERPTSYLSDHKFRIPIENVVDHGCGLGLSTLRLAELYPKAQIIGTNCPGIQLEFNRWLLKKRPSSNVRFIEEDKLDQLELKRVYLIALEVFEHFKEPLVELRHLIELLRPSIFVESSSFTAKATGHFNEYIFDDEVIPGPPSLDKIFNHKPNRRFGKAIRSLGYDFQPQYPHEGRPRLWLPSNVSRKLWGGKGTPTKWVYRDLIQRHPFDSESVLKEWRS